MIKSRIYEFITPNISDILYCSICRQVFHKPQRIICAHTFCGPCLQEWLKLQKICPICRTKTNILYQGKDLIAQKFIEDLMVRCKKCNWEGKRGSFQQHLKSECQSRNSRSKIISLSIKKQTLKEFKFTSKCVRELNKHYLESAYIDKDGNIQLIFKDNQTFDYKIEIEKRDSEIPLYSYYEENDDHDQIIILDS